MKKENQLTRIQSLIENDRCSVKDEFTNLLIVDLIKTLKEYFDFNDIPKVSMERKGDRHLLNISLLIINAKKFSSIPK